MRILFIGDIVGRPGRTVLENNLRRLEEEEHIDITIANGENAAGGFGMDRRCYDAMSMSGVDVFTMGNHTFDNRGVAEIIENDNIVRPLNLPAGTPGCGLRRFGLKDGTALCVVNLMGRVYNNYELADPFHTMDALLKEISLREAAIFVDFHADATSEKVCFGRYLNGRVSAVVGTHTHIQTADERILSRGTAYITDAGMTGGYESCLGMAEEAAIARFLGEPGGRLKPAGGERQLNGVVIETNEQHRAIAIKRIHEVFPDE